MATDARVSDADLDRVLAGAIDVLFRWLRQKGWRTQEGLTPPDAGADERQQLVADAARALLAACSAYNSQLPQPADEPTRTSLVTDFAGLVGNETDDEVLALWRQLPPWEYVEVPGE